MTKPATMRVPDAWMRPFIRRLAEAWGAARLVAGLRVGYNPRLCRSLARVSPAAMRVSLHRSIEDASRSVAREILAHELAHLVAAKTSRKRIRPHGDEWARLMESAGFPARPRIPFALPDSAGRTRSVYNHVCPVCHAFRRAKRPVSKWRCTDCVANGLDGTLVIEEITSQTARCSASSPRQQSPAAKRRRGAERRGPRAEK